MSTSVTYMQLLKAANNAKAKARVSVLIKKSSYERKNLSRFLTCLMDKNSEFTQADFMAVFKDVKMRENGLFKVLQKGKPEAVQKFELANIQIEQAKKNGTLDKLKISQHYAEWKKEAVEWREKAVEKLRVDQFHNQIMLNKLPHVALQGMNINCSKAQEVTNKSKDYMVFEFEANPRDVNTTLYKLRNYLENQTAKGSPAWNVAITISMSNGVDFYAKHGYTFFDENFIDNVVELETNLTLISNLKKMSDSQTEDIKMYCQKYDNFNAIKGLFGVNLVADSALSQADVNNISARNIGEWLSIHEKYTPIKAQVENKAKFTQLRDILREPFDSSNPNKQRDFLLNIQDDDEVEMQAKILKTTPELIKLVVTFGTYAKLQEAAEQMKNELINFDFRS